MSKDETGPPMPIVMTLVRTYTRELEKAITTVIKEYEKTTGLTVRDIELIHTLDTTLGEAPQQRIMGIKLDVRI